MSESAHYVGSSCLRQRCGVVHQRPAVRSRKVTKTLERKAGDGLVTAATGYGVDAW